jgi:hypothetical protein
MKNARGSKSARTQKAPKTTPTEGGAPEVTLDDGTVAVLPDPAEAPAPRKRARKAKPEPTVASKTEARRAAARDTTAEMAKVPETTVTSNSSDELDVRSEGTTPAPKNRRTSKPKGRPKTPKSTAELLAPAAKAGSLRAIGDTWLEVLRADGHTPATVSSYANDLGIAYEHLGGNTPADEITVKQIAAFNASKGVVKTRTGRAKAQPTILKTRRALRLALTWAEETKLLKKAPYPAA